MTLLDFLRQKLSAEQFSTHSLLPFCPPHKSSKNNELINKMIQGEQKQFNVICREEMNILAQAAYKANIRIAFWKGLVLSDVLYSPPETRVFCDIDLLINLDDLKYFLEMSKSLGYGFHLEGNIDEGIERFSKGTMHHYELKKSVYNEWGRTAVLIEAHTHVYRQFVHQIEKPMHTSVTKSALEVSVLFDGHGFENMYVMNNHDHLLALVMHLVKHFFNDIKGSMKNPNHGHYFNMQQLLDIDLFIAKHNIDYAVLFERAIEWNIVSELVFILKIIQIYNPSKFSEININEIYYKHRRRTGFIANSIDYFIENEGDFDNLFELLLLPPRDVVKYCKQ